MDAMAAVIPAPMVPVRDPGLVGYLEPVRLRKTRRIVGAFIRGAGGRLLTTYTLDVGAREHVFWGQIWGALHLVPDAIRAGVPYWHIDNGWINPGRGEAHGYYRVTRNSPSPTFTRGTDPARAQAMGARFQPWRTDGSHVLICLPGANFGRPWGLKMEQYAAEIEGRVRLVTGRPIRVRPKQTDVPLARDLAGAWCVVTHSSNVAVDAVLAGVPAVVEPTAPTAPLGNVGLEWINNPHLSPLRGEWLASLCWQQFTPEEMREGLAWEALQAMHPPAARG